MSFFPNLRTLRSRKIYSITSHPASLKIAGSPATRDPEPTEKLVNGISNDLIEGKIRVKLGLVNEQISTLTQLLNQSIQESSARNFLLVDTRTQQTPSRRSPSHEKGTSRRPPASSVGSTGNPPNKNVP